MTLEVAQTGSQPEDRFRFGLDSRRLEPLQSVIVRSVEPKAFDMAIPLYAGGQQAFVIKESCGIAMPAMR